MWTKETKLTADKILDMHVKILVFRPRRKETQIEMK
jgi:hypothetical protein